MDEPSIPDPRILEALEVCRPGSDDASDPALRELAEAIEADPRVERAYQRLQAVDGKIAAAFSDVPIPEGLEQQILLRLAAEDATPPERLAGLVPREVVAPEADAVVADSARRAPRRPRRWLLAAAGTSAVAAAVAVMALLFADRGPQYSRAEVLSEAIGFFQQEKPEKGRTDAPPAGFPMSHAVAQVQAVQWRWVSGLLTARGVAYDLRGPRGVEATLYVVKRRVDGLPAGPAGRPHTTGGCSVEAWQQGELLYMLVVNSGDRRIYRQLLEYRHGPLA